MTRAISRFAGWWLSLFTPQCFVGWVVGGILSASIILTWQSTRPPSRMLSATEDDGIALIGGQMIIKYHSVRHRYCRNSVTRWLFDPDFPIDGTHEPLWIPLGTSAAPPTDLGDHHFAVALTIPATVTPGQYHYVAVTDYSCGLFSWLEPASTRSPDSIVHLARPNASSPPEVVVAPVDGAVTVVTPGAKP